MAFGTAAGSARTSAPWSGWASSSHRAVEMSPAVVSWPARRISTIMARSSSCDRCSPSASTLSSPEIRSSPGSTPALLDQVRGVGQELVGRDAGGRQEVEFERQLVDRGDGVGPPVQQPLVGRRHVQQVGHGQDRDGPGDLLQDVEPVPVVESVQDRVDGRLDARAQLLDPAGGECLGHQAPHPGVHGRVDEEQRVLRQQVHRGRCPGGEELSPRRRCGHAETPVPQHSVDVGVARQDDADLLVTVDGGPGPQRPVPGDGVVAEGRVPGVPVGGVEVAAGLVHGLRLPYPVGRRRDRIRPRRIRR